MISVIPKVVAISVTDAPILGEPGEGLELGHGIGIEPGEVLDQGCLQRRGVITRCHHGAW